MRVMRKAVASSVSSVCECSRAAFRPTCVACLLQQKQAALQPRQSLIASRLGKAAACRIEIQRRRQAKIRFAKESKTPVHRSPFLLIVLAKQKATATSLLHLLLHTLSAPFFDAPQVVQKPQPRQIASPFFTRWNNLETGPERDASGNLCATGMVANRAGYFSQRSLNWQLNQAKTVEQSIVCGEGVEVNGGLTCVLKARRAQRPPRQNCILGLARPPVAASAGCSDAAAPQVPSTLQPPAAVPLFL